MDYACQLANTSDRPILSHEGKKNQNFTPANSSCISSLRHLLALSQALSDSSLALVLKCFLG